MYLKDGPSPRDQFFKVIHYTYYESLENILKMSTCFSKYKKI